MFPTPKLELYERLRQYRVILCSTSPRRLEILRQLGIEPEVAASHFEENVDKSKFTVSQYVQETATGKILSVWKRLDEASRKNALLISGDTVVDNSGKIYEKPKSFEVNVRMLQEMRDSSNDTYVRSGVVALVGDPTESCGYRMIRFVESTKVVFRDVSDEFIRGYCGTGEGLEVAGGFRIQGYGASLIDRVDGDFYNVVGLPCRVIASIGEILGCKL